MPSWIKIRADLESDPRVHRMAAHIAKSAPGYILTSQAKDLFGSVTDTVTRYAMRDVTVMGLSRVWFAANDHTTDGVFRHADLAYLDDLAHIPGFGQAMQSVGYAILDAVNHTVTLPRFEEYNAPDKNGARAKTAAAQRQQRHRDKVRSRAEVTPPVTSRHNENNVTPSLSSSSSISESSDSALVVPTSAGPVQPPPPDPDPLATLKRRINALRPQTWAKAPHWGNEDERLLLEASANLAGLDDQDWHLLTWFFRWANSSANNSKDPVKITTRRGQFCQELPAYLDRATTTWKQAGAPKLTAAGGTPPRPPPPSAAPPPPAPNENAFLGLLQSHGGELPAPKVTTKPAATAA